MTYDVYLDSRVLSADPMELVRILYDGALESIRSARRAVAHRDIAGRARMISKAVEIVSELAVSVDQDKGGSLGKNLVELYDYMQRRLLEANAEQTETGLIEVERLLCTLQEAWAACQAPPVESRASNDEMAVAESMRSRPAPPASTYEAGASIADSCPEESAYGSGLALRF
jgi:flagellar secretion chaperone FliS